MEKGIISWIEADERSQLKDNLKLSDAKGMHYSIEFDKTVGKYVVIGTFSFFSFYQIFTPTEVFEEKCRQIEESVENSASISWVDRNKMIFAVSLSHTILVSRHSLRWLDDLLRTWKSKGLKYNLELNNKRVVFDISDDRFTPNYLWALRSVLYRFKAM